MEISKNLVSFRKVIFWQRVVAFMLLISIVTFITTFLFYFFLDFYDYQSLFQTISRDFYIGTIIGITCIVGFGLICYLNWTLFRAAKYLKYYAMGGEMKDWEEAIKYRTIFWKLFTLSPFIAIGLLILMVLGVIAVKEIIIDPQMIEESIIIG